MRTRAALVAVALAVLAAGCATGSGRLEPAEFAKEARAVCGEFNAEGAKLNQNPRSPEQVRTLVTQTADLLRRQEHELAKLEPPRGRIASFHGWLEAQRSLAGALAANVEGYVSSVAPDNPERDILNRFDKLTLAEARKLAERYPSLESLVTLLENTGATTTAKVPQEQLVAVAQEFYATTPGGRLQAEIGPLQDRVNRLNAKLGTVAPRPTPKNPKPAGCFS